MEDDRCSLTIFFPCHNEEDNVERVTAQALDIGRRVADDLEVIIVNDGSSDGTAEIADRLSREIPEVRAVHHPTNLGYGSALQSGFGAATKDWVFYTDGDGQFDLQDLPEVLQLRAEQVVVSAYRPQRQDSVVRRLNAWCWTALVNAVFGLRVRDIDCAFKLFPTKLFKEIDLRSTGALIDTEVLAKASRLGYRIKQLGVRHYPRLAGEQSGANLRVILRAFKELLQLRRHIRQTVPLHG